MLFKALQAHIFPYIQQLRCDVPGDSSIQDTLRGEKPPKHCFKYRTATKQQLELEICVHDIILHPSEEKEMERNEMRYSLHLHTEHPGECFCGSVAQGEAGRDRVRVCFTSVRHSAFRVSGWFLLERQCQARESRSSACAPLLFIHLLSGAPPSHSSHLTPSGSLPGVCLTVRSPLHLCIFPLNVLFLFPLCPPLLPPSVSLSSSLLVGSVES